MEDFKNFDSPLMRQLLSSRDVATKQLSELNIKLSETKPLKRGGVKKAIRNVEQEIKRLDKAIDKERNDLIRMENKQTQQMLAEQGIDSRANLMSGIADIGQAGAQIAGAIVGKGGVSAIGVEKQKTKSAIGVAQETTKQEEVKTKGVLGISTNMMLIAGGVIVVLLMLMKKK